MNIILVINNLNIDKIFSEFYASLQILTAHTTSLVTKRHISLIVNRKQTSFKFLKSAKNSFY
jgi:hypothetical protein